VYDEILVPRMFEPWATQLVRMLRVKPGETVLDVACGPGVVARVAAEHVGPSGRVAGCDASEGMLSLARSKEVPDGAAPVTYVEASADALPFQDGAFDVVTCQQGIQFFPDRLAAAREMYRMLRPGGRVGITAWTAIENSPPFDALAAGLEAADAELAARYRAGPYAFTDGDELQALLDSAGFDDVVVAQPTLPVSFEGGAAQIRSTLAVTPVADAVAGMSVVQRERLVAAMAQRLGDGPVDSTLQANIALGHR
jgi:ubiquinone/menaquinone biosynthesis C-methylase UbiE